MFALDDKCIQLFDQDELFYFMGNALIEHMCPDGAIFAISYDDKMYVAYMNLSDEDEEPLKVEYIDEIDLEFFAEMDAEYRFCCYGLIIETSPGNWKIIEN